jgi:aconitate decarboxylase
MTETPETILLRHVLQTPAAAIPPDARAAARRFMADALAVGLAGTAHPGQPGLLAAVASWGAGEEAGVWGEAIRLPAGAAAFANAFAAHSLEFDAIH